MTIEDAYLLGADEEKLIEDLKNANERLLKYFHDERIRLQHGRKTDLDRFLAGEPIVN